MEKKELICIGCPLGCNLLVEMENAEVLAVRGNTCPRGEVYARKEITNPTRIVTSTMRVEGGQERMVSCKTETDIQKEAIFKVIDVLRTASVAAPVHIGDVLIEDVASTGVNVIATKNISLKG